MSSCYRLVLIVLLLVFISTSSAQKRTTDRPDPKLNKNEARPTTPKTKSFYLVNSRKAWRSAKAFCEEKGDQLATINSEQENNQVLQTIQKQETTEPGLHDVWLAGYCPHLASRNCYWNTNKTAMSGFTYFHPGYPVNSRDTQYCVQFIKRRNSWKWIDWFCTSPYYFICEHNPK